MKEKKRERSIMAYPTAHCRLFPLTLSVLRVTEATIVRWLPSGNGYIVAAGNGVFVYSMETSELTASSDLGARVHSVRAATVREAGDREEAGIFFNLQSDSLERPLR